MKNTFQFLTLAILSLIFLPNLLFGQLYEVSLDEKIQKSSLIVEGKVIESKCYRVDDETIYTAHKIKVSALLKGEYLDEYLTITTWGGEIEGELQTWTHLLTLNKGERGIFFLEPTRVPAIKDMDYPESFDVYAASQGFVQFVQNEAKAWVGHEPFHTYSDIPSDLFAYIGRQTGQKMTLFGDGGDEKRSGIRYHFTDIGFQGNTVTFNIYVNSLIGNKKLYKSGIQLGYNPVFFGPNIATSGNLLMQDAGISLSSTYDLTQSNVTSSKVKIELIPVGTLSGLTEITTSEQLLAKGSISIQNLLADPGIIYDIAEMQAMSKFYEGGLQQVFDTVIVEGDWRPSSKAVTITSISPLIVAGGVEDIITIKGSGFGTSPDGVLPPLTKRVLFTPAPEVFPPTYYWSSPIQSLTQYVSWSDTEIKVRVPSTGRDLNNPSYMGGVVNASACSEFIGIFDLSTTPPSIITSPDPIYVKYSAVNQAYSLSGSEHVAKVKLADRNSDGGYYLYYTPQFATLNSGSGVSAFERALITWRCNTLVNFRIKNFTSTPPANACKIDYGPLPPGVPSATKASTPLGAIDICGNSVGSNFFYLTKFDMVFSNDAMWHSEISQPTLNWTTNFDLETVALHELGHAHLLWHTNNPANVMHGLANKYKRTLTADDLEGGNYIVTYSTSITLPPCTTYMHMTAISLSECSTVGIQDVQHFEDFFLINPNPASEGFTIQAQENHIGIVAEEVRIYNVAGQLIKAIYLTDNNVAIQIKDLSSGAYIIVVRSKGKSFAGKLIKH